MKIPMMKQNRISQIHKVQEKKISDIILRSAGWDKHAKDAFCNIPVKNAVPGLDCLE